MKLLPINIEVVYWIDYAEASIAIISSSFYLLIYLGNLISIEVSFFTVVYGIDSERNLVGFKTLMMSLSF